MKKFKVEISRIYTIDVLADSAQLAESKASTILDEKMRQGVDHYYEGDPFITSFDVTYTDDSFDPEEVETPQPCYCAESNLSVPHYHN